jgi:hypothetical protein
MPIGKALAQQVLAAAQEHVRDLALLLEHRAQQAL